VIFINPFDATDKLVCQFDPHILSCTACVFVSVWSDRIWCTSGDGFVTLSPMQM